MCCIRQEALRSENFRIAKLLFGLFVYALGIVLTLRANLGYSPWEVFHQGLGRHIGITIGMASVVVAVVIVLISAVMKEHVGFGTLCNMLLIGIFIDMLLRWNGIPLMQNAWQGLLIMMGGLLVIGVGSFFYIGAGYGAGPRDSLMVVLTKRTGKSVGVCRCALEATVLCLGWLLGGYVGIGTVISALGVGVAVQIVFTLMWFDVRTLHQESCIETWTRVKNYLSRA